MQRREFLKLSGLWSVALFAPFHLEKAVSLPVEAVSQGVIYRGTADGKIFTSANSGKSWQLHTNFGAEISITDMTTDTLGQIYAQLGFAGHSFELALAQNGRAWRTM